MSAPRPELATSRHMLYRMFNAADELLYVGITADVGMRFADHGDSKPWWLDVSTITIEHHADRPAAMAAEKSAIAKERPRHNQQHMHPDARTFSVRIGDDLWIPLGEAARELGTNRNAMFREFIQWYLSVPGAQLPQRPVPPVEQQERAQ